MASIEVRALMGQLQSLHSRIADFEDVAARMQDQLKKLSVAMGQKVSKEDFNNAVFQVKESINHVESEFSQSQLDTHCLHSKVSMIHTQMVEHEILKQDLREVQMALDDTATLSQIAEMKADMESFFSTVVEIDEFKGAAARKSSTCVGENPQIDICEPEARAMSGQPLEIVAKHREETDDHLNSQSFSPSAQQITDWDVNGVTSERHMSVPPTVLHNALTQSEECADTVQLPQTPPFTAVTPPLSEPSPVGVVTQSHALIVRAVQILSDETSEMSVAGHSTSLSSRAMDLSSQEMSEVNVAAQMPSLPSRAVTPPRKEASEVSGHRPSGRSGSTIHIRRASSESTPGEVAHTVHQQIDDAGTPPREQAAAARVAARAVTPPRKESSGVSGHRPSGRSGSTLHIRRGSSELAASGVVRVAH